jgi:lysophospholipase L1-like esterase
MASRDTIQDIVARVRYIARGHSVAIVLMGYWNAWLDGRVAAARGPAYVATSRRLTQAQNSLILGVARSTAAIYVDLWRVFRGVDDHDDTALLADDGDHPNALGHTKIAISVAHALRVLLRA